MTLVTTGEVVKDLSRHFIEYWNYASYQTHYADRYVLVSRKKGLIQNIKGIANDIKTKIQKNFERDSTDREPTGEIFHDVVRTSDASKTPPKTESFTPPKKKSSLQPIQKMISRLSSPTKECKDYKLEQKLSPSNETIF